MSGKYIRAYVGQVRVSTDDGEAGIVTASLYVKNPYIAFDKKSKHKRRDLWEKQAVKMCRRLGLSRYKVTYWGRYVGALDSYPDLSEEIVEIGDE